MVDRQPFMLAVSVMSILTRLRIPMPCKVQNVLLLSNGTALKRDVMMEMEMEIEMELRSNVGRGYEQSEQIASWGLWLI